MLRISIFLIAMVSLLILSVSNATEVILKDTPNVGDTTTITTATRGILERFPLHLLLVFLLCHKICVL